MYTRPESENHRSPFINPLEGLEQLVDQKVLERVITYQETNTIDGRPTVLTRVYVAPTTPAETVGDLNDVVSQLPLGAIRINQAEFTNEDENEITVPNVIYSGVSARVKIKVDIQPYSGLSDEVVQKALENETYPGPREVGHQVTIFVFPTVQIAQTAATSIYEFSGDMEVRHYDETKEGVSLNLSRPDLFYLNSFIPAAVWNPNSS